VTNQSSAGEPLRKPRLAILINSFRGGGAERVVSLLWPRLERDFEVYLVLLSTEGNTFQLPPEDRTHVLEGGESQNWLNIARLPRLARSYRQFLDAKGIDISLSFLNRPNFINCLAKRAGWRGKTIISERAVTSLFYKSGARKAVGRFLIRRLYPLADAIIPISRGVEYDLRTRYGVRGNYLTIYNPIDITQVLAKHSAAPERDPLQPFTFVCVARFDPQKNQALLVEAFAQLGDLPCRLRLVGQGPGMAAVAQQVRALGLESRVELTGFQKAVPVLKQSDCFVLSSDFEGLGNVILEALACSLPVISTDCFSGPREILAPDTDYTTQVVDTIETAPFGILTPVRNATLLAQAMRRIITDQALRAGYISGALARAREFDVEIISDAYRRAILATVSAADPGRAAEGERSSQ